MRERFSKRCNKLLMMSQFLALVYFALTDLFLASLT